MKLDLIKRKIDFSKVKYQEVSFDIKNKGYTLVDHRYKKSRFDNLHPIKLEQEGQTK